MANIRRFGRENIRLFYRVAVQRIEESHFVMASSLERSVWWLRQVPRYHSTACEDTLGGVEGESVAEAKDPLDPHSVHNRASFLTFVRALAADYRLCAPHGPMVGLPDTGPYSGLWNTLDLGEFLDAGVAWVEQLGSTDTDFPGTTADFPPESSWAAFAWFLFLAKTYYPGRDTH